LLANEKFDSTIDNEQLQSDEKKISNGANDEELTSLTWLHDKNLLKGYYLIIYLNLKNYLKIYINFKE
jgi:hypothetical protein